MRKKYAEKSHFLPSADRKMFDMVSEFKEEQNIDDLTVDIEALLRS